MDTGKVVLGALAGLATGAILGILFAPEKGTETRKKIATKGKDSLEDLKNKYNDLIDSLSSKLDDVKSEGKKYIEEGKKYIDEGKEYLHDGQEKASNAKNQFTSSIK
ncbi:MAG: YtxH domain-containing protein [Flavobacterium sp.]|nr:YtxH domain-containing protein [Flavobacterium sp.]